MPRTQCQRRIVDDPFAGIDLERVGGCLRAIGHPDRLRMIAMLLHEDLAVNELVRRIGLSQPTVSGHLRLLQSRGMLTSRRDGHRILYHIASPALPDICRCIREHFGSCSIPRTDPVRGIERAPALMARGGQGPRSRR